MLDTLTVSRTLVETGLTPAQADAIAHAVQQAAEHGDPVTRADLTTAVAELNARSAERRDEDVFGGACAMRSP